MLKIKRAHLIGGLFLLLASCSGSKNHKKLISYSELQLYQQHEARRADIPLILDVIPLRYEEKGSSLVIIGTSTMAVKECFDFYKDEMERLGWKLISDFDVRENKLIFQKPYKICLVEFALESSRPQATTLISIYCSAKK